MRGRVAPAIGKTFGGYTIESELGRGGMGTVYLATHERLARKVALKVLAPELAHDERFRARFLRESQLAASIDHPNVIPIFDADEVDGVLYLAMRYVAGPSMQTLLRGRGRFPPEDTQRIAQQIAGALDAAHAAGLVHRDVKPANVLMTDPAGSHVYLCDFGLAKRTSSRGMTHAGFFLGTVDYSAPEQIRGQAVDGRADVYSLGCLVFHCLAGHPPYVRESEVEALNAHLTDPPPSLSSVRPDLPASVDGVIETAMAKKPESRYPSAGELVAALGTALRPSSADAATRVAPSTPVPERKPRAEGVGERFVHRRGTVLATVIVVLVVGAAAGAVVAMRGEDGNRSNPPNPRAVRAFVDRVETVLEEASTGRRQIGAALADGLSCRIPPDTVDDRLQQVVANRRSVLARLAGVSGPTPEATTSLVLLRRGLSESISVDTHYRKAFRATTICPLPESDELAAAQAADRRATAAKQAFVATFNPLARRFHRPTWRATDI